MKINGIDINTFNARLVNKTLESAETSLDMEWPEKALLPYIGARADYKFKKLLLDIEFKGDFSITNFNKSKLLKEISSCVITDIGLNPNTLTGGLVSHSVSESNMLFHRVEYELNVIEEMPEKNVTGLTVVNPGTGVTPVKLEITPSQNGTYNLYINKGTINEIKIILNNMVADTTRIIGLEAGIFEGINNKFLDTVLYDFPKLQAGENIISIVPSATIKSTFRPRVI